MAGISTTRLAERQTAGSSGIAIGSALPASISTTARRSETSCNGSKVALRSSTRPMRKPTVPLVDAVTTARRE